MDPIHTNCPQMTEIEADARRFAAALPTELILGRRGTGWMVWDDDDHCVLLDFFGEFEPSERSRATTTALEVYDGLRLPYSLRIGFHQSEEVARRTMLNWFGVDDSEADEAESNETQIQDGESKTG